MRKALAGLAVSCYGGTMKENDAADGKAKPAPEAKPAPKEIGGPKGPEPTRYGDWEVKGRCSDF
jgi:hypothetical protein